MECNNTFYTLVVPPGDPYPGAPGLMEKKIKNFSFERCPTCNASFRQMVVKVIAPVGDL